MTQTFERVPIDSVTQHERNPHKGDVQIIGESIRENGWWGAVIVQRSSGKILAGNHRWLALKAEGVQDIDWCFVDCDDRTALKILLSDNRTAQLGDEDGTRLAEILSELQATSTLEGTGYQASDLDAILADLAPKEPEPLKVKLSDRFLVPPFSVLNAREGWWQDRKRAWLQLGIQSEIGRGGGAATPPHCPTVTKNPDGTLNYNGTAGQSKRFDRQKPGGA